MEHSLFAAGPDAEHRAILVGAAVLCSSVQNAVYGDQAGLWIFAEQGVLVLTEAEQYFITVSCSLRPSQHL